jgi:hypothetical protein
MLFCWPGPFALLLRQRNLSKVVTLESIRHQAFLVERPDIPMGYGPDTPHVFVIAGRDPAIQANSGFPLPRETLMPRGAPRRHENRFLNKVVTPAEAGVQCFRNHHKFLDTGFRRYDVGGGFPTDDKFVLNQGGLRES